LSACNRRTAYSENDFIFTDCAPYTAVNFEMARVTTPMTSCSDDILF